MSDYGRVSSDEIETGTVGRACDACHRKKTKCDMQQPVCGLCRRTNKRCHFPSTRKRPSRQEPSTRAKLQKVNGNLDRLVELLEADPSIEQEALKGLLGTRDHSEGLSNSTTSSVVGSGLVSHDKTNSLTPNNVLTIPIPSAPPEPPIVYRAVPVSRELARHLVDIFFVHIQPWLSIFHQPSFLAWTDDLLTDEEDSLSALPISLKVLLHGVFALSARFSNHPSLSHLQPRERGERFIKVADHWFRAVSEGDDFDLTSLKACVLLAYYHYASGCSKRGWFITHMCIRGCYELGLHQIDEGPDSDDSDDDDWMLKESLRRTFWAINEIDSFGSIVKRKPFAIDYRHVQVKMPVSDEAWFSGQRVESAKFIPGPDSWKTLIGSPNQAGRPWLLLSKGLVAHIFDLMLFKEGVTAEQISIVENSISCFKMAMPESFQLSSSTWSKPDTPPARTNWMIATNLYLAVGSFMLTQLPIVNQLPSPKEELESRDIANYRNRVTDLNEIIRRWPPEALSCAHPLLSCTILTYDESLVNRLPTSPAITTYRDLSGLILTRIAERWQLGAVLLRIRDLSYNYHVGDEETRADLVRQYPLYFAREICKNTKSVISEVQKTFTFKSSPSARSAISRHPRKEISTPDKMLQGKWSSAQQRSQHAYQTEQHQLSYDTVTNSDPMYLGYDPTQNMNNTNQFQDFTTLPAASQSPEDLDALFAGFLQEPWWQDLGGMNFVV